MLSHHLLACRKRKAVVLALRGTMSMADIVTDAVAHPEEIDDWLPPHFAKVCWSSAAALPVEWGLPLCVVTFSTDKFYRMHSRAFMALGHAITQSTMRGGPFLAKA